MPRLAVVLDTNAYRSIGAATFSAFRADESNHSVVAYASYFAATELLAHLASEQDPDFRHCFAAAQRLAAHCRRWDGSQHQIEFLQVPDAQVARVLFGRTIASDAASPGAYSAVLGAIADDPHPGVLAEYRDALTELRVRVLRAEREFTDGLWKHVVLSIAPDAEDWQSIVKAPRRDELLAALDAGEGLALVAGTIVDRSAAKCGIILTASARTTAITRAQSLFATSVHHHDLLVRLLVRNGPNMRRPERANSVWDHEISFSTSLGAVIAGVPLVLVTDDPILLQAAGAAGTRTRVWSLAEYRSRLADRATYVDMHLGSSGRSERDE